MFDLKLVGTYVSPTVETDEDKKVSSPITLYSGIKATTSWNVVEHHFLVVMWVCGVQ